MIKLYFKQSWQVIKQNKLFSGVYILGTALSIALVMAYAIVWYVQVADIYPELNRDRCLYMGYLAEVDGKGNMSSSSMSGRFIETVLPREQWGDEIETVVVMGDWPEEDQIYSDELPEGLNVSLIYASAEIVRVFDYRFLYGGPFTQQDLTARAKKVFISQKCARELFGVENAVGRRVRYNQQEYEVCGVVKNVSLFTTRSYADIWFPLSEHRYFGRSDFGDTGMLGSFAAVILARSASDLDKIKEKVASGVKRLNSSFTGIQLMNYGQPDTRFASIFRHYSNAPINFSGPVTQIILILLALLLVPAINLAGIIASGMEGRLEELGIRKAFGASRRLLIRQILYENFLLTFLGGVLGLVFSYLIVCFASSTLLSVSVLNSFSIPSQIEDIVIIPQMLFSPVIFLLAFGFCLILNILAAIVPAYISLRKNIVDSLTDKK